MNCSHQCSGHCRGNTICNHATGHCNKGCVEGWTGNKCETGNPYKFIFVIDIYLSNVY